jgi:hypothetical protein
MGDCPKCGGLGIICVSRSSCLDISCKDCGQIEPCPLCKGGMKLVKKPQDPKVLRFKGKEKT